MSNQGLVVKGRRVVTGVDARGRSTVIADEYTPQVVSAPAFTIRDIWESPRLPVPMDTPVPNGVVSIYPPKAGLVLRIVTFPPDSSYDKDAAYKESLDALQGGDTFDGESPLPGMHLVPDTLDVVTVVSGELHIVLETGETLLRQGDCVIVNSVMHSWSNKTDKPAVLCSLIQSATAAS